MTTQQELTALTRAIHNTIGSHFNAIDFNGVYIVDDVLHARLKRCRELRHPDEYGGAIHPAASASNQVDNLLIAFADQHGLIY